MAKETKHRVTMPDGTVAVRRSETRRYTHAVVARIERDDFRPGRVGVWTALTWTTQPAKALAREQSKHARYRVTLRLHPEYKGVLFADAQLVTAEVL
jgi:hypothetical protein